MRFLLGVYQPDGPPPEPAALERIMTNVEAVRQDMKAAGVLVFTAGLHPADKARVVRPQVKSLFVTDGPFAETKEHLGGFSIIDAADEAVALVWAQRLAAATTLPIEMRALHDSDTAAIRQR